MSANCLSRESELSDQANDSICEVRAKSGDLSGRYDSKFKVNDGNDCMKKARDARQLKNREGLVITRQADAPSNPEATNVESELNAHTQHAVFCAPNSPITRGPMPRLLDPTSPSIDPTSPSIDPTSPSRASVEASSFPVPVNSRNASRMAVEMLEPLTHRRMVFDGWRNGGSSGITFLRSQNIPTRAFRLVHSDS